MAKKSGAITFTAAEAEKAISDARDWLQQRTGIVQRLSKIRDNADDLIQAMGEGPAPSSGSSRRRRSAVKRSRVAAIVGRKRGRPKMSDAEKAAHSRRMKAAWKKRKAAEPK